VTGRKLLQGGKGTELSHATKWRGSQKYHSSVDSEDLLGLGCNIEPLLLIARAAKLYGLFTQILDFLFLVRLKLGLGKCLVNLGNVGLALIRKGWKGQQEEGCGQGWSKKAHIGFPLSLKLL
jgi:hypothetical protein